MLVPKGYPEELSAVLDAHAEQGVIPGRYVVCFFEIARDIRAYAEKNNVGLQTVLDIGGRSLPYLFGAREATVFSYEPRKAYHNVARSYGPQYNVFEIGGALPAGVETMLINLEVGGLAGAPEVSAIQNIYKEKNIKRAIAYSFKQNFQEGISCGFLDDGHKCDYAQAEKWFCALTRQEDLKATEHETIRIFDITDCLFS